MGVRKLVDDLFEPFVNRYQDWKHRKPLPYKYGNVQVNVIPGVFSPLREYSTAMFLDYIKTLDLNQKTVLELGCGSGIISAFCAQQGGLVTASDINEDALQELSIHSRDENWNIISVYSNLFENLHFHFDYIFINPPFKEGKAHNMYDKAYYAGPNFEYFETLFAQLKVRTLRDTEVLLFLPEQAELFAICRRAKLHHLTLKTQKVLHTGSKTGKVYRVVNAV